MNNPLVLTLFWLTPLDAGSGTEEIFYTHISWLKHTQLPAKIVNTLGDIKDPKRCLVVVSGNVFITSLNVYVVNSKASQTGQRVYFVKEKTRDWRTWWKVWRQPWIETQTQQSLCLERSNKITQFALLAIALQWKNGLSFGFPKNGEFLIASNFLQSRPQVFGIHVLCSEIDECPG